MAKQYTEDDLGILVAGDWSLVNSEGAEAKPGVGVRATQREKRGPWNYPREMVLTFPFSLNQFRDFCDWHTYFQWEVIEAQYLNDDGSLDEDALAELAQRGEDAAELVRRYLTGETDAEKEAGPLPTVDRADAPTARPAGQQDAPGSNEARREKPNEWWVQTKLTEVDKLEIVRLFDRGRGLSVMKLASKYGVSRPLIDKVLKKAGIKK